MERVLLVKSGIPASYVDTLATAMGLAKDKFYQTTGLVRPTVDRKIREDRRLSQDESERVIGIGRLIGQVQNVVNESGATRGFDAAKWTASWLAQPLPALGAKRPADLMDTAEGRQLVSKLLSQQQSGAYA
jgi:putative toxin-antitoxin system antitoxin component (TIGR02293 family)